MTWEAWLTLATVFAVLTVLARNLAPPDVTLVGGVAVLMVAGTATDRLPSPADIAAGFGNEGLLTVGVLFVVAAGLTETGALTLATDRLLGRPRSVAGAQIRLMLPVAALSAFLNNTPVVAMFIPVVNDWCRKAGLSPAKLFIPLSYAAVLGGTCTLIGTSTNLVVHGLMLDARRMDPAMPTFGMFTLGAVGLPATILGLLFILVASDRLLPRGRIGGARTDDPREYTVEMLVTPDSPLDGQSIEAAGLRHLPGVYLASVERDGERLLAVEPDLRLRGHDQLVFVGVVDSIVDLQRIRGLTPATTQVFKLNDARHSRSLVEAVVSDTSPLIGRSIREGEFRTRYNAVVIAVHRNGERVAGRIGDIVLRPGDALLLETHPRFLRQQRNSRDFFLVSGVPDSRPRRFDKAWIAIPIAAGMVIVAALEHRTGLGIFAAALIAAGLMGVTRCLSIEQARRSIEWPTLIAIGAAIILGKATQTSGLAAAAAGLLVGQLSSVGPVGVLAGVYLMTLVFTEIVTNNAAAALAFPVAVAAAQSLDVSFMPFAVTITMAASAGFATPLGYQTHLMVYGAGGYRFTDYLRIGIPLDVLVMLITVAIAPIVFPFR